MSKFKDFIKKFKYLIIVVGILIVGCIFLIVKKSFGVSTNTYTRDELQKMLVSAAVSYYYNNNYSDYEQYLLDADVKYPDLSSSNNECVLNYKNYKNATKCVSENNHYPLVSTTFFRNLNITPEEVSRSNMYNTDCTGFTYLVYIMFWVMICQSFILFLVLLMLLELVLMVCQIEDEQYHLKVITMKQLINSVGHGIVLVI